MPAFLMRSRVDEKQISVTLLDGSSHITFLDFIDMKQLIFIAFGNPCGVAGAGA